MVGMSVLDRSGVAAYAGSLSRIILHLRPNKT